MSEKTQIKISDNVFEDFKKTAIKWEKSLNELPVAQAQDVLKFMSGKRGIRGKMRWPFISASSQFGPYDPDRVSSNNVNLDFREIETFLGSDITKFHPNDYAFWTMGYDANTAGDGIKKATPTLVVLSALAKARGQALAKAVMTGKRNPAGNTTEDLFDGFVTIANAEIEAENISENIGNLYTLPNEPTKQNACDVAKEIIFHANKYLRREKCFLFCTQEFADFYNESYLASHSGLIYNKDYNQPIVEASNGLVTLVPLAELEGTDTFFLTPKENMIWATDNESDQTSTTVDRFEPFRLTLSSTMFFGVQFHSIDPRRLLVVKTKQPETD